MNENKLISCIVFRLLQDICRYNCLFVSDGASASVLQHLQKANGGKWSSQTGFFINDLSLVIIKNTSNLKILALNLFGVSEELKMQCSSLLFELQVSNRLMMNLGARKHEKWLRTDATGKWFKPLSIRTFFCLSILMINIFFVSAYKSQKNTSNYTSYRLQENKFIK